MSAYVVGLTGGIGSGKSTVADLFVERGATLVDTDLIAHQLTGPHGAAMDMLRAAFGDAIVAADGALDRAAMRQRVFSDASVRGRLEAILHPMIRQRADAACVAAQSPYVILAVPLLVESAAYQERCDRLLVIDCSETSQIERVMVRNGFSESDVRAILAAQATRAQRLAVADDVVINEGPQSALVPQVAALHLKYLQLAAQKT